MKWLNRTQAMKLQEGSAVLVRRPVSPPSYEKHFIYDMHGWFRPDLIRKYETHWEYLLVESPIKRKKKCHPTCRPAARHKI